MLTKAKKIFKNPWFKWPLIIFFSLIILHIIYITYDGMSDYKGNADVAIVLGNRVFGDGSLSSWLQGRVDKALKLYNQHRVKKIFVSGGISAPQDGGYPEGDAMKNYLVNRGVKAEDIIIDNKGINTYYTAKNFLDWNKDQHYNSAIVVSQFYHITRSKYILHKLGFAKVYNASSDVYSVRDIDGTLREFPAFYKYVFVY